jgi:hypothetical protein
MNVARASLEELLEDYRDFLRVRGFALWEKDSKEARFVRRLGAQKNRSYESYRTYIENATRACSREHPDLPYPPNELPARPADPPVGKAFLEEGGLRERMTRARLHDLAPAKEIERQPFRILDALLHRDQEGHGFFPVHGAVIVAKGEIHHRADDNLVFQSHGAFLDGVHPEDAAAGRIQNRRAEQ